MVVPVGDVWALMQAETARRPQPNAALRPLAGTRLENISDIPMDPSHPGWKSKIQPPADSGVQPVLAPPTPVGSSVPTAPADSRLTIYYSRENGYYNIAIERKPDWEIDGGVYTVREDHVAEMLPILQKVIKIKDTTGDFNVAPTQEQQSVIEGVRSDRPRNKVTRKKRAQKPDPERCEEVGPDHAADSERDDSVGWGLPSGDETVLGRSDASDAEGDAEDGMVMENPLRDPNYRKEFERKLKVNAYKKQQRLRKDLGVDNENDTRVGAPRDRSG